MLSSCGNLGRSVVCSSYVRTCVALKLWYFKPWVPLPIRGFGMLSLVDHTSVVTLSRALHLVSTESLFISPSDDVRFVRITHFLAKEVRSR